jgi:hypothetical protein
MKKIAPLFICAIFLISAGFCFCVRSEAAPQKKSLAAPTPASVIVDLPASSIDLDPLPLTSPSRSVWISAGISTWSPDHFSTPSFIPTGSFQRVGAPGIFINYLTGVFNPDFNLKFGLNWLGFTRTGVLLAGTPSSSTQTQELNLFSVRIGVEYSPRRFASKVFAPYASAALLPSVAQTSTSSFDGDSVYLGLPLEFSLGTRIALAGIGLKSWDLDVNATEVVGRVNGSSVSGLGIEAGVRVIL